MLFKCLSKIFEFWLQNVYVYKAIFYLTRFLCFIMWISLFNLLKRKIHQIRFVKSRRVCHSLIYIKLFITKVKSIFYSLLTYLWLFIFNFNIKQSSWFFSSRFSCLIVTRLKIFFHLLVNHLRLKLLQVLSMFHFHNKFFSGFDS